MTHHNINTVPDTIEFNLLHSDGRPFDHLQYMQDKAHAIKGAIEFEQRMLAKDRESLEYHRDQIVIVEARINQRLIDMGELALLLCRMRSKYKELARTGGRYHA